MLKDIGQLIRFLQEGRLSATDVRDIADDFGRKTNTHQSLSDDLDEGGTSARISSLVNFALRRNGLPILLDIMCEWRSDLRASLTELGFPDSHLSEARNVFLQWVVRDTQYVDTTGVLQTHRHVRVSLDAIYVPLEAFNDVPPNIMDLSRLSHKDADFRATASTIDVAGAGQLSTSTLETQSILQSSQHILSERNHIAHGGRPVTADVIRLVSQKFRLVLLGDPGGGKSTLVRYLALRHAQALLAEQSAIDDGVLVRFPILIRLADYVESGAWQTHSLSAYLPHYFARRECHLNDLDVVLRAQLSLGQCLVMLDGLDEIVSSDARRSVVQRIQDFASTFGGPTATPNHILITSRSAGYREVPLQTPFEVYTLSALSDKTIRLFLERWCPAVEAFETPDLPAEVHTQAAQREMTALLDALKVQGVRRLAENPLMLRTLALIHKVGRQLPQKRIDLYRLAAETLGYTWRVAQGVREDALLAQSRLFDPLYRDRLLGQLAYWIHLNRQTGLITESDVYRVLGRAWAEIERRPWQDDDPDLMIQKEIRQFLAVVREHTGLFVEKAPQQYGFLHLTFEEYYAARDLVSRSRTRIQRIRKHLHDPRWEEPILLALGYIGLTTPGDAEDLIEGAILGQGEQAREFGIEIDEAEVILDRSYLFVLRCLADDIPVAPALLETLLRRLEDEITHQTDRAHYSSYRNALTNRLRQLKGSRAGTLFGSRLCRALQDADPIVRERTITALSYIVIQTLETLTALRAALADPHLPVVLYTTRILKQWDITSLIAEFLEQASVEDATVRMHAIDVLSLLAPDDSKVADVLRNAMLDESVGVRCAAAAGLGNLHHLASPDVLMLCLGTLDSDPIVRNNAIGSLGRTLDYPFSEHFEHIVEVLCEALDDPDGNVRDSAFTALLVSDEGQQLTPAFLNLLKNANPSIRATGAYLLGNIDDGSEEVVTALFAASDDANYDVREAALENLARLIPDSSEAIQILLHELPKAATDVKAALISCLGNDSEETSDVIEAISGACRDRDDAVRAAGVEALGRLVDRLPSAQNILIDAFSDTSDDVRIKAVYALNSVKPLSSQLSMAVQLLLADTSPAIVDAAASILYIRGEPEDGLAEALYTALDQQNHHSVKGIVEALTRLAPDTDRLIAALLSTYDVAPAVCITALVAVAQRFPHRTGEIVQIVRQKHYEALHNSSITEMGAVLREATFTGLWQLYSTISTANTP